MSEYSWPVAGGGWGEVVREAWPATVAALPIGATVTGEVVGRQPFGVFLRFDEVPDAVGLAEILSMPRDAVLPQVGERFACEVIWHAEHNHQVKVRLTGQPTKRAEDH